MSLPQNHIRALGAKYAAGNQRGALTIALAVVLASTIYLIRDALPNPNEGVTTLYVIPVAIVAMRFGAVGGAVAALISLALFASWELSSDDVTVGPIGYASRGTAFLVMGLIVGRFATERRVLVARLGALATVDRRTGLANRHKFEREFEAELARVRRHGRPGAVLIADLDGFKAINDTLGHRAGDEVLRDVAMLLTDQVRVTDVVARVGGDEFVLLLPDTPPADAALVADRIREAVPARVHEVDGEPVAVGVSVGCATFDGDTTSSPAELLHVADEAMYRAKALSRRDRAFV